MKKLFFLMTLLFCLLFAGCSNRSSAPSDSSASGHENQRVQIAVATYSHQDPEVLAFRNYYENYISQNFEVDFIYSSDIITPEDEQEFLQQAIEQKVQGVISFISYNLKQSVETCEKAGIYYMMGSGSVPEDVFQSVKDNPWFLGTVSPDSSQEKEAGNNMADYYLNQDSTGSDTHYLILTGGAASGNNMHKLRAQAMLAAFGLSADLAETEQPVSVQSEKGQFYLVPGYIQADGVIPEIEKQLQTGDYSVLLSTLAISDLMDSIETVKKSAAPHLQVAVIDSFTDDNMTAVQKGLIQYVTGKYPSEIGPSFAAMYNAITGYADLYRNPDGSAFSISQGFWTASTPAQYEDLYALTTGIYVNAYNFEDLCQVINQYTPQATLDDLIRLAGAYSEDAVRSRRGQ